ncbi:hypothetical protein [Micromonospora sp. NPDC048830]|uniref:hypothetical protein n=1 Tax=Micromonospora sp. NPDC048830 TaxID=3364257 RepID=UPI003716AC34
MRGGERDPAGRREGQRGEAGLRADQAGEERTPAVEGGHRRGRCRAGHPVRVQGGTLAAQFLGAGGGAEGGQ